MHVFDYIICTICHEETRRIDLEYDDIESMCCPNCGAGADLLDIVKENNNDDNN